MSLNKKIQKFTQKFDVNYFGISDLSLAKDFVIDQGGNILSDFRYCISIGLKLPDAIVNQLPQRANKAVAVNYRFHAYKIINDRLDYNTSMMSNFIQELGYNVMPIPASDL